MDNYKNYENMTFVKLPTDIIGCNITNCVFDNCEATTFTKCNIYECNFLKPTHFVLSNVYHKEGEEIIDGCTFDRSNYSLIDEIIEPDIKQE